MPAKGSISLRRGRREPWLDRVMRWVSSLLAISTILVMVGVVGVLLYESAAFFQEVSIVEFFTGTLWTPLFKSKHFGVLPLISGTVLVSLIALAVAVPTGLFTAVYLSEYASERFRRIVKPTLEVLAGIPTVVLGYFALTTVTPWLRSWITGLGVFNALSAGLVTGLMILPIIATISEDAMIRVPVTLREGAYALGAKQHMVALRVVLPAALSGVLASIVLGLTRALGETMIVTIAAGSTPRLTLDPRQSVQAMTGYISQIALGEAPFGSLEYRTIFAVGITLALIVLATNLVALYFKRRFMERY